MNQDFDSLRKFVDSMNESNSTNHKIEVLKKHSVDSFVKRVLEYTYHPYKQYGVTSANLQKLKELCAPSPVHDDLFQMLDDLAERRFTGHSAIEAVNRFIKDNWTYRDLIYQVIDRNLETRATTTLINRVIPGLIPTFSVALAHDATKVKGIDLTDGRWFVSRKLDGVRCIAILEKGKVTFFSRNGKEFTTLGRVADELKRLGADNVVLDGEICMMQEDGTDDFQGILKQIQRKDHTIQNPKYWVFDILTLEEFNSGQGTELLSSRLNRMNFDSKIISNLAQHKIFSQEDLEGQRAIAKIGSWEGLIARRDVGYEGDRTKNMLKLKEFYDAEYEVVDVIMGPQRVIVNGHEVEEEVLSAIIIKHKGATVQVGSGFSLEERRQYHRQPDLILGAQVTVQYFEETLDQEGNNSLRFPVFKWNHGKNRSI